MPLPGGHPQGELARPAVETVVAGTDGVTWEMGLRIDAKQGGEHKIVCDVADGATAKFGIGKEVAAESLVGSALLLIGVPAVGILLAIVVTIVVLVKRSGARKRAAAASAGAWGSPYGG
nr:hypothetical protein GCM10020093_105890 [Planobispora longispora]